jgi:uracil-xanthine permease
MARTFGVDAMTESAQPDRLLFAVNESPPLWMALILGLQHVLVMYGEVALFPGIAGKLGGAPPDHIAFATFAAIAVSGLCTLIQVVRFGKIGAGLVIFMGSSTAYLACTIQALQLGGFALVATMCILSAPVELLISYFLRYLRHIITPAVGGTIILLIVISFMPLTIHEWMGEKGSFYYGTAANLVVGLITLACILGINIFAGKALRIWSPIITLAFGYLMAWCFHILEFHHLHSSPWFGLPEGAYPGIALNLEMKHLPILLAFMVVTVLNAVQTIGNCMLAQTVSIRDFKKVDYNRIQGALNADGVSNIIAGLAGTLPNETYSENIPVLKMTGVASRSVGLFAVALIITLAFMPKVSAVVLDMPEPVFAGFLVGLLAMMFHSGLRLILQSGFNNQIGLMVGISVCVGIIAESRLFFPGVLPPSLSPLTDNGIAAGGLAAVLLSTAFHLMPKPRLAFGVPPSVAQLPTLVDRINKGVEILKLTPRELANLHLACEEIFVHVASHFEGQKDIGTVQFQVVKDEDGVFAEIQAGKKLRDVDGPGRRFSSGWTQESDLGALGLHLLRNIARDIKHIHISGFTYLSFRI